jgi:enoyl-CoA hydratase/carnithine racemase
MNIRVVQESSIAILKIANPPVNALSYAVRGEIAHALEELAEDREIGAVVLTGDPAVRDIFCGGSDITEFEIDGQVDGGMERAEREMAFIERLSAQRLPLIAAVNGPALGGGLELVLACDLVIAASTATFGFPEIGLGIFPGSLALPLATRILGPNRAKLLSLTADPVDATWMERAGLVSEIVPREGLMARAKEVASRVSSFSQLSVCATRKIVQAIMRGEPSTLTLIQAHADRVLRSPETRERIDAFFASRRGRGREGAQP